MSETTTASIPEPEKTSRKFLRVIGSKIAAGAKRVASLFTRGAVGATHGVTYTLDKAAVAVRIVARSALWLVGMSAFLAFALVLFAVTLVAKAAYFVVLVVRTPHLALFHRPALREDWSIFLTGLRPSHWLALTPQAILREEFPQATVTDLLAHSRGKKALNPLVGDEGRVLDVEEAHEQALFEELTRRDAARRAAAEGPKGRSTPKQRKSRLPKLPRTA